MSRLSKARAAVAVLIGLLLGLIGATVQHRISDSGQPWNVEVNGNFGSTVVVSTSGTPNFQRHDGVFEKEIHVEIEGKGRTKAAGQQLLARINQFEFARGKVTELESQLYVGTVEKDQLGDLTDALDGIPEGSRIQVVSPYSPHAGKITVVDVLPTVLQTEDSSSATLAAAGGLPGVAADSDGIPSITAPGGSVATQSSAAIITGAGEQLTTESKVVVNYLMVAPDGSVLENSWQQDVPPVLDLSEVFAGLNAGLTDQRVGSRVVLAIPARLAQGNADIAMIVDILAVAK